MAAKGYLNSAGVYLSLSGATTKGWAATGGGKLLGTSGNDALRTGGSSTLIGGDGDDTYYVYTAKDTVIEKPNEGIDTIISSSPSYTLPDNVENLVITASNATGVGNKGDNIITSSGTGPQTLNGGAGNDVLVAGVGQDTFVVAKGEGSDVIVGFKAANDLVQLNGYSSFSTFAKVKAAMSQVGADTIIDLGGGETLTLRDHKISDFTADNFRLPIDKSLWSMTFSDEFNSFSGSASGKSTTWMTTFPYSGTATRTLPTNKEAQYYSDSSVGVNPFSIHDGVLDITAARATPGVQTPAGSNLTWTSGLITTYQSFSQLYGYFEVKAQLPAGQGFWPAFWLLPADNTWPPELDIFEVLGNDPTTLYASTHSKIGGPNVTNTQAVTVSNVSTGFHTYGVNWQSDYITWYIDGAAVAKAATPADMHKPMYMLLNLGVGGAGSWPGAANDSTPSEAHMLVDYVRAYTEKPATADPVAIPGAPSIALAKVIGGLGAAIGASIAGTAQAGALVGLYDGTTLIGTATADAETGAYTATLSGLSVGTHTLTTKAAGSASSASITVVVGTSADIVKQLPTLQKMTDLGGIVLTDTTVLAVGSVAEMNNLMINDKGALASITGSYSFAVTSASANTTVRTLYDKTGTFLSSTSETTSNGVLSYKLIKMADGTTDAFSYKNGILASETQTHPDGIKDVFYSNIIGKSFVAEHDVYDASGTFISMVRTRADGSNDTISKFDPQTGQKVTDVFDATGEQASRTIVKANGDLVQQIFSNNTVTSEYMIYAPNGKYAAELKTYSNNVLMQDSIAYADRSKEIFTFNVTDQDYTNKHQIFDAVGNIALTDLTLKDGTHTITGSQVQQTLVSTQGIADVFKGMGSDTFVFDKPSGRDIIQSFHAGSGANHDVIKIASSIVTDFAHLSITTSGADSVIHLGTPDDTITLKGIAPQALTHDNFWFV